MFSILNLEHLTDESCFLVQADREAVSVTGEDEAEDEVDPEVASVTVGAEVSFSAMLHLL